MDKTFSTTDSQLKILRERGMVISDSSKAKQIIERENYYNLINGYKRPFLSHSSEIFDECFLEGTKFEEIYALYQFDRELRNLFIKYILQIENNVKSVLAYDFSEKHGHDNYLRIANFNTSVKRWEKKTTAQKIGEVSDLVSKLQHEIARHLSKNNPMISHYMLKYGYIPFWVLVNVLSFGTVSIFYSYLTQRDQNDVGKHFQLKPNEMNSFLQVLTIYRNACAHGERFYNLKAVGRSLKPNDIYTTEIHKKMHIPINKGNNPIYGKNDLFAIVIIFKIMLPENDFDSFFFSLEKHMGRLDGELHVISIRQIEKDMGFPANWMDIMLLSN